VSGTFWFTEALIVVPCAVVATPVGDAAILGTAVGLRVTAFGFAVGVAVADGPLSDEQPLVINAKSVIIKTLIIKMYLL